jgi:hypothetical protein
MEASSKSGVPIGKIRLKASLITEVSPALSYVRTDADAAPPVSTVVSSIVGVAPVGAVTMDGKAFPPAAAMPVPAVNPELKSVLR